MSRDIEVEEELTTVYQLDLDEEIISHLCLPDSLIELKREDIDDDFIVDEEIKEIYLWQRQHIRDHKIPATATVLADEFDLDISPPLTAIGDLIERLRLRWLKNNVRAVMAKAGDDYKEDPAKLVQTLPVIARELTAKVAPRGEQFGTGDYERSMVKYDAQVLAGPGPTLGYKELNDHFHGMRGVGITLASPKTFKSWLTVHQVAENIMAGHNPWLYSLELPAAETDMRIRCLVAGVPYWRYLRSALSKDDRLALKQASDSLDNLGTYKVKKPPIGRRTMEEMIEIAGDAGADVVYIDQLQYVETKNGRQIGAGGHTDYWQPLNIARDLSDYIPIQIVHQFNRTTMGMDRMPDMQQAKGAAAIEEVATLCMGLWANKDMRASNIVEYGTLCSRNYTFKSWEIQVELSKGCNFELIGEVEEDE